MDKSSENSGISLKTDNLFQRAEKLKEKSLYREALLLFKKALDASVRQHDQEQIVRCMMSLGDTFRMVGNFDLAQKQYADATALIGKIDSPIQAADARVGLALSLRAQGEWQEALNILRESKQIYQKIQDSEGVAFTLWAEAGTLRIKGDITNALQTFRESYKRFQALGDLHGTGYCLCGLGGASRIAGSFKESLAYYTAANRIFLRRKDTFGKAYSYCGIGNAYRMLKDYQNAFRHFAKAVRLYKTIGDRVSYAYTLWGLSTTYKMTGNFTQARHYLREAMALFKKTRDPRGIIYCQLGLGEIALLKGQRVYAQRHLTAAQEGLDKYHFGVEECYAKTLFSLSRNRGIDHACYSKRGLRLQFEGLPLNIP